MITGSLQKKNDMYYAVMWLVDNATGKRKQKWVSTGVSVKGNNKRKAGTRLNEIIAEYENTEIAFCNETPFIEWLWKWMEQKKCELRINSHEAYELYPYRTTLSATEADTRVNNSATYSELL